MLVRSTLIDLRPFRTGVAIGLLGPDDRVGREPRGRCRLGPGRRPRALHRGGRLADRRHRTRSRRAAARHRCLGRRAAPPLGERRPAGRQRSSPVDREHRVGRLERRRPVGRRRRDGPARAPRTPVLPVDGMEAYPDVVAAGPLSAEPPPLLPPEPDLVREDEPTADDAALDFEPATSGEYRLPDRALLKASPPTAVRLRRRQRPHRAGAHPRRSRTSASRRRWSAPSPARGSSATSSSSRRERRSPRSRA